MTSSSSDVNAARNAPTDDVAAFAASLARGRRLIGIDVGTKTLGLALSDVERTVATALETIQRTKFAKDGARLMTLADEHGVGGYVVGLPMNMDGSEGPSAQSARAFARNLAKLAGAPILFWDERMSTVAAERALIEADTSRKKRDALIDKVAAAIILQGAIDRMQRL